MQSMSFLRLEDDWLRFAKTGERADSNSLGNTQMFPLQGRGCGYRGVQSPGSESPDLFPRLAWELAHLDSADPALVSEVAAVDQRIRADPASMAALWLDSPARALVRNPGMLLVPLDSEPFWMEQDVLAAAGIERTSSKSFGDLFIKEDAYEVAYGGLCDDFQDLCTWAVRTASRAGLAAIDEAFPEALAQAAPAADLLCAALRFGQQLGGRLPVLWRWQLAQWVVRCALASPVWGGSAALASARLRALVPPTFFDPQRAWENVQFAGEPAKTEKIPGCDLGTESCEGEPLHPYRIRPRGGVDPRDLCLLAVVERAWARGHFQFRPGKPESRILRELAARVLRPLNPVQAAAQCAAALSPHCSLRMPADSAGGPRMMTEAGLPWVDWIAPEHQEQVLLQLLGDMEREEDRNQLMSMLDEKMIGDPPMRSWLPRAMAMATVLLPKKVRWKLAALWEVSPDVWGVALGSFASAVPAAKLVEHLPNLDNLPGRDRDLAYRAALGSTSLLAAELARAQVLRSPPRNS